MVHQFLSGASGLAVLVAVARALSRASIKTIGNFWLKHHRGETGMSKKNQPQSGDTPPPEGEQLQGEGDYKAARRYREEVSEFLAHHDVEQVAKGAAPHSALEARELALAEESARNRSKGDDSADVAAMYPGRKPDAET
jgi:hypothetical protein